jgi:hypothetical protein
MKNGIKTIMMLFILAISFSECKKDEAVKPDYKNESRSANDILINGKWEASFYKLNGLEHTDMYKGYVFEFQEDGIIMANNTLNKVYGKWSMEEKRFYLNFSEVYPFTLLSECSWEVINMTSLSLELKGRTGTDGSALITFTKL